MNDDGRDPPESPDSRTDPLPAEADALINKARALYEMERFQDCLLACTDLLALSPGNIEALYLGCISALQLEDTDSGLDLAGQLLQHAPDRAESHIAMALSLSHASRSPDEILVLGKTVEAHFQQAIRLDQGYARYYVLYAEWLARQRRLDEALVFGRQALALDPNDPEIPALLQGLYRLNDQEDLAEQMGQLALSLSPDHAVNHMEAGFRSLSRGRSQEAKDHFRDGLRLEPSEDYFQAIAAERCRNKWLFRTFPVIPQYSSITILLLFTPLVWLLLAFLVWMPLLHAVWITLAAAVLIMLHSTLFRLCLWRELTRLRRGDG